MNLKRKLAVGAIGLFGLLGSGNAALAHSGATGTKPPPMHATPIARDALAQPPDPWGQVADPVRPRGEHA
jgi:hypothetical protein